jgi:glyoxylase-like metal-dependent hydrolase (beta-lactamase superfamily II)
MPAKLSQVRIGDIDVVFVPDGYGTSNPTEWFSGLDSAVWDRVPEVLDDRGALVMSLGSILVRTAGMHVLVDLGLGPDRRVDEPGGTSAARAATARSGELITNLGRLGVTPDDIDAVLLTHLHPDHIGWLVDAQSQDAEGARATFRNADYFMSEPEWTYWRGQAGTGRPGAPKNTQLEALERHLRFAEDGDELFPGVDVIASYGHTPGHLCFGVRSHDERLIILGDAVHCPVEFAVPSMTFALDWNGDLAVAARRQLAQLLVDTGAVALAPHFPDFVFGEVSADGNDAWAWSSRGPRCRAQAMTGL